MQLVLILDTITNRPIQTCSNVFESGGGGHSSKNKEPPHPPNFFVLLNPENSNLWEGGGGDVHIPTRTLISLLIS